MSVFSLMLLFVILLYGVPSYTFIVILLLQFVIICTRLLTSWRSSIKGGPEFYSNIRH